MVQWCISKWYMQTRMCAIGEVPSSSGVTLGFAGLLQGVIREGFGAHGILRETDMYSKRAEFQAWAIDVQKVDVEIM